MRGFNDATLLPPSLLARVTSPTYMVRGEEDPMGGADIARQFAEQVPNVRLELMAHAGHAPWIDDPELVAALVAEFLRH